MVQIRNRAKPGNSNPGLKRPPAGRAEEKGNAWMAYRCRAAGERSYRAVVVGCVGGGLPWEGMDWTNNPSRPPSDRRWGRLSRASVSKNRGRLSFGFPS